MRKKNEMKGTPEYKAWSEMKQRCQPHSPKYKWYGARGISVCAEWKSDFQAFYSHVGPRPSPAHSLDRIDNDGNYEPENVRWATHSVQTRNTTRARTVTIGRHTRTIAEWSEISGVPYQTLWNRIKFGMPPEDALKPGRPRRRPDGSWQKVSGWAEKRMEARV